MKSHLLVGRVTHRRLRPFGYQLEHRVWQLALDLDELDLVDGRLRLLSRNRRNIVEVRDADHLPVPAFDLARDVRTVLAEAGLDADGWAITLVTNPRVAGYVFNPASFYLCHDGERLAAVLVEVHNTYGERHLYPLLPAPEDPADRLSGGMPKAFDVSPFLGLQATYRVHVRDEPSRLVIAIEEHEDGHRMLATSLVLERRRLTDPALLGLLVRRPFVPQRTIAWIHWHALRLWLRGAPFHRHRGIGVGVGPTAKPDLPARPRPASGQGWAP
jgi:hypothetical protein